MAESSKPSWHIGLVQSDEHSWLRQVTNLPLVGRVLVLLLVVATCLLCDIVSGGFRPFFLSIIFPSSQALLVNKQEMICSPEYMRKVLVCTMWVRLSLRRTKVKQWRIRFSLAKEVSESVLPSNHLGWRGKRSWFMSCCLGASRFSISIGSVHNCVVANRKVVAITIPGGYPSHCSHVVAFSETTDPRPLPRSDCLRNSGELTGILRVNQFTWSLLTSLWLGYESQL